MNKQNKTIKIQKEKKEIFLQKVKLFFNVYHIYNKRLWLSFNFHFQLTYKYLLLALYLSQVCECTFNILNFEYLKIVCIQTANKKKKPTKKSV